MNSQDFRALIDQLEQIKESEQPIDLITPAYLSESILLDDLDISKHISTLLEVDRREFLGKALAGAGAAMMGGAGIAKLADYYPNVSVGLNPTGREVVAKIKNAMPSFGPTSRGAAPASKTASSPSTSPSSSPSSSPSRTSSIDNQTAIALAVDAGAQTYAHLISCSPVEGAPQEATDFFINVGAAIANLCKKYFGGSDLVNEIRKKALSSYTFNGVPLVDGLYTKSFMIWNLDHLTSWKKACTKYLDVLYKTALSKNQAEAQDIAEVFNALFKLIDIRIFAAKQWLANSGSRRY